jgi:hypothetical protein
MRVYPPGSGGGAACGRNGGVGVPASPKLKPPAYEGGGTEAVGGEAGRGEAGGGGAEGGAWSDGRAAAPNI